jgi:hypothetical protein
LANPLIHSQWYEGTPYYALTLVATGPDRPGRTARGFVFGPCVGLIKPARLPTLAAIRQGRPYEGRGQSDRLGGRPAALPCLLLGDLELFFRDLDLTLQ